MEAVQKKSLTDVRPAELCAVDGGFGPVGVALFLVGCAEAGYVSGVLLRKTAEAEFKLGKQVRDQLLTSDDEDDESVPVAPGT